MSNRILVNVVLWNFISFSFSFAQERVYQIKQSDIVTTEYSKIDYRLQLTKNEKPLLSPIVNPLILDGLNAFIRFLPKLLYRPTKYISENQATFNFFRNDENIKSIDENVGLVLEIDAAKGKNSVILGEFHFEIGSYKAHKGYYYMGLKKFELVKTSVKLKPKSPNVNLILEVLFEYYDANDTKQEFVLEPFYLNTLQVPTTQLLNNPQYQLLPKMEVLESVTVKLTEVNSKKPTWDKWLGLYEKHQGKLPPVLR